MLTFKRLRDDQSGSILFTASVFLVVMLAAGLALLSVVDTQAGQTREERVQEAAFNLAEGALNAQAFLLSRSWPENAAQTPSGANLQCGLDAQALSGTLATPPATTTAAQQTQKLLAETFTSSDYAAGGTWKVNVCEDPGRTDWDNSLLVNRAFDSTAQTGPVAPRRLWVRAQAAVRGERRAVVGLVQADQVQPLPKGYAVVAGGMTTDVGTITSGPVLGGLLTGLLGAKKIYAKDPSSSGGGRLGIRCDLTSSLDCVTGTLFATVSQLTLSQLLLDNDTVRYRSDTAVAEDTVVQLRRQAQASGTYLASVAANAACLPAGSADKVVFIEKVGNGDQACRITASGNARALVVANGRVQVVGSSNANAPVIFQGVLYALFRQRSNTPAPSTNAVVSVSGHGKVRGAVYIDGQGRLAITPPPFDLDALVDQLIVCGLPLLDVVCWTLRTTLKALGVTALVNELLKIVTPVTLVNALLGQLSGWGPVVEERTAVVDAVRVYGSSGIVPGTFRQVPPS